MLQHLDGTPQAWPTLHERNAEWWATHDDDGLIIPTVIPPRTCRLCGVEWQPRSLKWTIHDHRRHDAID